MGFLISNCNEFYLSCRKVTMTKSKYHSKKTKRKSRHTPFRGFLAKHFPRIFSKKNKKRPTFPTANSKKVAKSSNSNILKRIWKSLGQRKPTKWNRGKSEPVKFDMPPGLALEKNVFEAYSKVLDTIMLKKVIDMVHFNSCPSSHLNSFQALFHMTDNHISIMAKTLQPKQILEQKIDGSICNIFSSSLMHYSILYRQPKVLSALIVNATNLNCTNMKKQTPLFLASDLGDPDMVNELLQKGANPDVLDQELNSPLIVATKKRHYNVVHQLLSKMINPESKNAIGLDALFIAVTLNDEILSKILLNHPKVSSNISSGNGPFRMTPVHVAAGYGFKNVFIQLTDYLGNMFPETLSNKTPLHFACQNGHKEIVQLYLDTNSPLILKKDLKSRTAIATAISYGHSEIAEMMIQHILDKTILEGESKQQEIKSLLLESVGNEKKTFEHLFAPNPLHQIQDIQEITNRIFDHLEDSDLFSLSQTCSEWNDKVKDVYYWIQRCNSIQDHIDWKKLSAELRRKYYNEDFEEYKKQLVKILMKLHHNAKNNGQIDTESNNGADYLNLSPYLMCLAAEENSTMAGELIIPSIVSKDLFMAEDDNPMITASKLGNVEMIAYLSTLQEPAEEKPLEERKPVDIVHVHDREGVTPLHWVSRLGHVEAARFLISVVEMVNNEDINGETALINACEFDHPEIVKMLLGVQNIDVTHASHERKTALHYAARNGHLENVKSLLPFHLDHLIDLHDTYNRTPLHFAAKRGHLEVVKLLLDPNNGGSPARVNNRARQGVTALHAAVKRGHLEVVKFLLLNGANANATTIHKVLPIHLSAGFGHLACLKELMKHTQKLDDVDMRGRNILHYAAKSGHAHIVTEVLPIIGGVRLQSKNNCVETID